MPVRNGCGAKILIQAKTSAKHLTILIEIVVPLLKKREMYSIQNFNAKLYER